MADTVQMQTGGIYISMVKYITYALRKLGNKGSNFSLNGLLKKKVSMSILILSLKKMMYI